MTPPIPVNQMDTGELAAEYELLTSSLPAMRHLPTVTLNKALELADRARFGVVTDEERTWIRQLAVYSCQHAARFVETTRRMAELLQALAVEDPDCKPDPTRQVNPIFNYGELSALVNAQRTFSMACEAFVDCNRKSNGMLPSEFTADILQRLDAEAIRAAEQLTDAFATPAATSEPLAEAHSTQSATIEPVV